MNQVNLNKFIDEIKNVSSSRNPFELFTDFCTMYACALSNTVDRRQPNWNTREEKYLSISKKYNKTELNKFAQITNFIIEAFEENPEQDFLGEAYMALNVYNKSTGQYFTNYYIAKMMSLLTGDTEETYSSVHDSCMGSSVLIIAEFAKYRNNNRKGYAVGCDIDINCVHMAYIQFTLLDIPAILYHGDSLINTMWSEWKTFAFIRQGWTEIIKNELAPFAEEKGSVALFCLWLELNVIWFQFCCRCIMLCFLSEIKVTK